MMNCKRLSNCFSNIETHLVVHFVQDSLFQDISNQVAAQGIQFLASGYLKKNFVIGEMKQSLMLLFIFSIVSNGLSLV